MLTVCNVSFPGADLMALLNLGYNLAERDSSCKTPRDIAVEHGVQDNVNAIGITCTKEPPGQFHHLHKLIYHYITIVES